MVREFLAAANREIGGLGALLGLQILHGLGGVEEIIDGETAGVDLQSYPTAAEGFQRKGCRFPISYPEDVAALFPGTASNGLSCRIFLISWTA